MYMYIGLGNTLFIDDVSEDGADTSDDDGEVFEERVFEKDNEIVNGPVHGPFLPADILDAQLGLRDTVPHLHESHPELVIPLSLSESATLPEVLPIEQLIATLPVDKQRFPRGLGGTRARDDFRANAEQYRADTMAHMLKTGKRRASGDIPPKKKPSNLSQEDLNESDKLVANIKSATCKCRHRHGPCWKELEPHFDSMKASLLLTTQKERILALKCMLVSSSQLICSQVSKPSSLLFFSFFLHTYTCTLHFFRYVTECCVFVKIDDEMQVPAAEIKSAYVFNGVHLCRNIFLAIFNVSHNTVDNFFEKLRSSGLSIPCLSDDGRGHSLKGFTHERTNIALRYIDDKAAVYGLPCPDARGSKPDLPVIFLPQLLQKTLVYTLYKKDILYKPLSANAFFYIWRKKKKFIKVATRITDYCETCNNLSQRNDTASQQALSAHRLYAHQQREHYKRRIKDSQKPDSKVLHLTMDFAENVYLPYQHRQV
jgi:hypothetical protein